MKRNKFIISSLFLLILIKFGHTQNTFNLEKIGDAVVVIEIYNHKGEFTGHGSGFVIDPKGVVVTNYHVIEEATTLKVVFEENGIRKQYFVESILSGDKEIDIAKLLLKNPLQKKFPSLSISKTLPKKGDDVFAIGTPADPQYMNTISKGLVSNIHILEKRTLFQINAEISHGSSGGALINNKGEVIGITSMGDNTEDGSRANINFAIWIGGLYNLPSINKVSLVNPELTPCELSFYTNIKYIGKVLFYIDGLYIGTFSKYFQNDYTPTCNETGTITKFLSPGKHSYEVYFDSSKKSYYGSVTLKPGQCDIYRVGDYSQTEPKAPSPTKTKTSPTQSSNSVILKGNKGSVSLSNSLIKKYNLSSSQLKELHFFISSEVKLQKVLKNNNSDIKTNSSLSISATDVIVDEIIIPKNSSSVCVKIIDDNKIAVSFDSDDNKYLVFGDPNNKGRYYLMAADWNDGIGKINYGDKIYYVMQGGARAYLNVKFKKEKISYTKKTTKVKGRK